MSTNKNLDRVLIFFNSSEIAEKMGVSISEVSRWRNSYRLPRADAMVRLGDALAALRAAPGKPTDEMIAAARLQIREAVAADAKARRRPRTR